MRFNQLLKIAWTYKIRNLRRTVTFDVQNFFLLLFFFIFDWLAFLFFTWSQLIDQGKAQIDVSVGSILSGAYQQVLNLKALLPISFTVLLVALFFYILLNLRNYIQLEKTIELTRLKNYYKRVADSRHIMVQFFLSHLLFVPFSFLLAFFADLGIDVFVFNRLASFFQLEVNVFEALMFYHMIFIMVFVLIYFCYSYRLYLNFIGIGERK